MGYVLGFMSCIMPCFKGKKMEDCEILEAIENVKQWLNCDDTWDNDLDGYDCIDCCEATLRKLSQQLTEIKNRK